MKVVTEILQDLEILKRLLKHNANLKIRINYYLTHVAYQIKADDAGSNMVANILPTDTPSTQGVGSKGQTISFSESSHVEYQIKGN